MQVMAFGELVCDGGLVKCGATVTNWYQPGIPPGVAPVVNNVEFQCR
jgi:hypothetical protein